MDCGKKDKTSRTPEELLAERRRLIDLLFDRKKPCVAARSRWIQCAFADKRRYACNWIDKLAGGNPSCEYPDHRVGDLYAALGKREFRCPEDRF